jgi:hypothetical protein
MEQKERQRTAAKQSNFFKVESPSRGKVGRVWQQADKFLRANVVHCRSASCDYSTLQADSLAATVHRESSGDETMDGDRFETIRSPSKKLVACEESAILGWGKVG